MAKMITKIEKHNEDEWNAYISKKENANIFHTLEWKKIIEKTYGYEPLYLISKGETGIDGILPFFCIKTMSGKKFCSNPFSFYSEFLYDNQEAQKGMINEAINMANERRIDFIELKSTKKLCEQIISTLSLVEKSPYIVTKLDFPDANVENSYDKKLLKNIRTLKRNFEKDGFEIGFIDNKKYLEKYYDVMVREYRDKHMMLCQPYTLLRNIYETLYEKKMMDLLIIKKNERVLAGALFLKFNNHVEYFMGSSDQSYLRYSFSTILIDHALKYFSEKGFKSFNFGTSSRSQTGLIFFKERWGSKSTDLFYYYKGVLSDNIPAPVDFENSYKLARKMYKRMPISVIKKILPHVVKRLA
jgi:predicted N-acyltransferase